MTIRIVLLALLLAPASVQGRRPPAPVQRLIDAALSRAGLARRQDGWRSRLAWSSLLPRLSIKVARTEGWGEYVDLRTDQPAALDTNAHQRTGYEIRASWDLSRLVFDPRELAVARTADARTERRQKLIERITRLYYQREALLRAPRPTTPEAARARGITIARVTATLEAMSGVALGPVAKRRR